MFRIKADPTFDASLTLVGQGREQVLNLTFRHKPRTVYLALLDAISAGKKSVSDVILELVEKWDADGELNKKTIEALQNDQPGVDWAIVNGYSEALVVARKGN